MCIRDSLLVGRRLQHLRLVHDENAFFEQPCTRTLNRVRTSAPDDRPGVWGGEFGVEAIRRRGFDERVSMATRCCQEEER